jgi:hypothetical protein
MVLHRPTFAPALAGSARRAGERVPDRGSQLADLDGSQPDMPE